MVVPILASFLLLVALVTVIFTEQKGKEIEVAIALTLLAIAIKYVWG